MTKLQFVQTVFEKLDKGKIFIDDKLYYSDEAVLECLEWMYENLGQIIEIEFEEKLRSFEKRLTETFKIEK